MTVAAADTSIFPRNLDRAYPNIERGDGVWLYTTDGREILDGCSGGAMVTGLGHGRVELVDAATAHLGDVAYMYNHFFTSEPQERLAALLIEVAAPEMARVRLVSGGSEANETALRMARQYHVDRGDEARWQIISPAQSYHGSTMATLALSGRPALQAPYGPYLTQHLHIPPATPRFDPTGQAALDALDQALETAGPENVSAFYCEPVSAAALPAYSPPDLFWEGLAERRERNGFLVCFDEIVSGIGRTGRWMAYQGLPIEPDIVTIGNGLGAGYAPLAAMLCREPVYRALAVGSKYFDLGHTWDGAALPCSFGLAVLDYMVQHDVVARVAARGPGLRERIEEATRDNEIIGTVRGRGFLLGVEYVDPRDGTSILPADLNVGALIDSTSLEHGLLVLSTHPNAEGYAGDQTVIAPAFTSTDEDLEEMIDRFGAVAAATEKTVKETLSERGAA